ncbi:hypothetical protein [Geomesophilobacter sediminis]|uniref:Isoquinoline 1-oxidoreductase subunit n=1 Tax=Geomesophilobacter sediminis TaxID=2798584 RepID=A0A8J7M2Z8_9BACT|nr:hypothetical protein [Geomesophilobacter sediminis]MBJ6727697.1 hypothetical protein [Geomesophilobacter sediminis]
MKTDRRKKGALRLAGFAIIWLAPFALVGAAVLTKTAGLAFAVTKDDSASAAAFLKAAAVFSDPRCVNCHPAGNRPLVGDQSLPHPMHVERGPQGLGRNGLWCSTCHQEKNLHDPHTPPGAPEWMLPPADMPMVFEKRTPRQLCEQFKDPARNGSRTPTEIAEHVREAPTVLWGWHPGEGRRAVPMPHDEFVRLMTEWAEKGAACPE